MAQGYSPRRDYTGERFGFLVVRRLSRKVGNAGQPYWWMRCDCGREKQVCQYSFKKTKSCGCQKASLVSAARTTHGETKGKKQGLRGKEYQAWAHIKDRCHNKRSRDYERWGGRGIRVCKRWRESFATFLEDVGRAPTPTHQIDRIDNEGHYEPGNVRWATAKQQANNRRKRSCYKIGYTPKSRRRRTA